MKFLGKRARRSQGGESSGVGDKSVVLRNDDGEVQLSVRFSKEAYDMLRKLAEETGKSEVEILRDALALERAYQETRSQGGHVLTEREGKYSELVLA